MERHPLVGEVRGIGLMQGMEFVRDVTTREPFPISAQIAGKVTYAAMDEGLIVYPGTGAVDGVNGDHRLITPPLTISREQIDELAQKLERAIAKVEAEVRQLAN